MTSDNDLYTWKRSSSKEHLFNQKLSKLSLRGCQELYRSVGSSIHAIPRRTFQQASGDQSTIHLTLHAENHILRAENSQLRDEISVLRNQSAALQRRIEDISRNNVILDDVGKFYVRKIQNSTERLLDLMKLAEGVYGEMRSLYPTPDVQER